MGHVPPPRVCLIYAGGRTGIAGFRGWSGSDAYIRGGKNDELFGFISGDESGIPSGYYDAEKEDYVEGGFMEELATHLVDGWVAIVREIGYEKMRYLVGYTVAINAAGESVEVTLDQIYDDAKRLGREMTECEY